MKLIYLHQYFKFPTETGGTRSYDLASSFLKNGIKVTVVSSTSDLKYKSSKRWTVIDKEGLNIHYIYLPYGNHLSYFKRIVVFFKFLWFSTFRLLKLKGDLVLATSTPLTIGIPALIKKWFSNTPYVFEVRDVWPEAVIAIGAIKNKWMQKILYWLEKLIYKNAFAIVPLSSDMKMSIVSRYPEICKNKPIVVIENISEVDRFSQHSNSNVIEQAIGFQPRFTILYAGTFGRVNGIDYVIDLAIKTLEIDASIVYVLIGVGAMKEEVIKKAKEEKVLNKNVFILGSANKQDLPNWYSSVDMGSSFVIPIKELWANSANKFFDTLAASKPVLINHEGWQAEVIREDNLGYVLPEIMTDKDVHDFVAYTQNTDLHIEQMKNAFEKAKTSYSLDVATRKYLEVFDQVFK